MLPESVSPNMDRMAASAPAFLAPPGIMREIEAGLQKLSDGLGKAVSAEEKASGNDFLNVVRGGMAAVGGQGMGEVTVQGGHLMGRTENDALTFLSSGSRCLDFFFQVVPTTPDAEVERLLAMAWQEDALKALKLIFHLRGVRGTGKSDKEQFYLAAMWLHDNHPATLCANVAAIAEFGYFKDLLEVLVRLVEVSSGTQSRASEEVTRSIAGKRQRSEKEKAKKQKRAALREAKEAGKLKPREERVAACLDNNRIAKQRAASLRKEKREGLAREVTRKFYQDSRFQNFYLEVAKVFAERLKADLKAVQEGKPFEISLSAKWAPSLASSYDLQTLMCYAIATLVYPKENHDEYASMDDQKYGYEVRERLRREVLVPLRKVLELPEVYMSAQKWGDVNYRRVASVAMSTYKKHFLKHDKERFKQFLSDVESGKERVAAGALFPHDILMAAWSKEETSAKVADLQWRRMVEDLKKLGSLTNCLAMCDVSGSMSGEPMHVCIALGILISELSEEPWKGNIITFSDEPNIHKITGDTLKDKAAFVSRMDWGNNTNLQLVFDRILAVGQAEKLAPEKMIKRLFIFSDMEFDEASSTEWGTDYDAIVGKFKTHGFGKPPEIVFWNLRHSLSVPVIKSEPGVGLVSGFSKNMLKVFLEKDGVIDPMTVMDDAIKGEEYSTLKVVD